MMMYAGGETYRQRDILIATLRSSCCMPCPPGHSLHVRPSGLAQRLPSSRTGRNQSTPHACCYIWHDITALCCRGVRRHSKHDVIHKTGSTERIAKPPEEDRDTAMRNMHKNFDEVWKCAWFLVWTDRQTDGQTRSSQYFAPHHRCGLTR